MKNLRLWCLVALAAAVWAAAASPAAAAPGPAATPDANQRAPAAAVMAADPATVLARWTVRGSGVTATEARVARGMADQAATLHHALDSVTCEATVQDVEPGWTSSGTAVVHAHVITTAAWHAPDGGGSVEASGVDHVVTLARSGDAWLVCADSYSDELTPAYLEAAGASPAKIRAAGRLLERAAQAHDDPAPGVTPPGVPQPCVALPAVQDRGPSSPAAPRRYADILVYDRDGAQSYADRYALSYNPTYVRFSADCADFASQCARAGGMPTNLGGYNSGWWYDKRGTSSPSDDTYSLSWINVAKQIGFWNGLRTDWVSSISGLSRGDFIYYDWTGDGTWDHAAVVAGTNSAGQKVIDAHTTDLYHVYWKLGYSTTHYRYAHVRPQWVVS
jgi:hypothetical protein